MARITPLFFIALVTLAIPSAYADSTPCFIDHIQQARQMNIQRRPLYEAMSQGVSKELSERMIRSETFLVPIAWSFELFAEPLRKQGIDIFCDNLVSMSHTPAAGTRHKINSAVFDPTITEKARERLQEAFGQDSYQILALVSGQILQEIEGEPQFHCMLRHLTESIRRAAVLAPHHIQAAEAIDRGWLARFIIASYIKLQIVGLMPGDGLDRDAAPLQAQGIGIVCDDVPPIGLP